MPLMTPGRVPGPLRTILTPSVGFSGGQNDLNYRPPGPAGKRPQGVLLAQAGLGVTAPPRGSLPDFGLIEPEPLPDSSAILRAVHFRTADAGQEPQPDEVEQGAIANCALPAVLVALAHSNRPAIKRMIKERPAAVFSRRKSDEIYRYWTDLLYEVQFRSGPPIKISTMFYVDDAKRLVYARSTRDLAWVSCIEKAYAVFRGQNSYGGLNGAVPAGRVMEDLAGPHDVSDLNTNQYFYPPEEGRDDSKLADLKDDRLTRTLVHAESFPTISTSKKVKSHQEITEDHAYAVLRFAHGKVKLRDPWGGPGANVALLLGDFKRSFSFVMQSRSKR